MTSKPRTPRVQPRKAGPADALARSTVTDPDTPFAVVDRARLERNPGHAYATAAQHRDHQVISSDQARTGQAPRVGTLWPRSGGW